MPKEGEGLSQANLAAALRARREAGGGAPRRGRFLPLGPLPDEPAPRRKFLTTSGPPRGPLQLFSDVIDKIAEMGSRGGGGEEE